MQTHTHMQRGKLHAPKLFAFFAIFLFRLLHIWHATKKEKKNRTENVTSAAWETGLVFSGMRCQSSYSRACVSKNKY